ncbi:MAG: carboxypeptidase regulatory-like domain-containing protein [Myxococcota bacterium]|nr:carboxypeptidase regulatory-like domain-containing protein [Deltaproteobacteria bacterium]MDQ3341943.1 carboxypeptidase regulatory-like domain-containing protein [Myxococcota bacterium]
MKYALALIAVLVWARPADACSCAEPPPPCEALQAAPVVFIGKVTDVKTAAGSVQEATFAVAEKIKGGPNDNEIVEGGGMCGTVFQKGKTYIVYAGGGGGRLSSSLCGRTQTIDRARDDVVYARSLGRRTLAMLEGVVAVQDTQGTKTKRGGIDIRVRGTKFRARTDKTGRYKLELPPGKYTLDVVDPKATVALDANEVVSLADASACVTRDIALVWNGRVRGRVLGLDGRPAAEIQITLVSAGSTRAGNMFATTNSAGAYEFIGVQAGDYTLVAYGTKGVPTTTYYPGVDDAQKAKAIKLSQSGVVQKIDFKLLP